VLLLAQLAFQPAPPEILDRISEEAEMLRQNAPKTLTQETLQQRALRPPSRFRPRIGKAATQAPRPRLQVREILSEYSIGSLRDSSPELLVEFRQVISVDGRKIQTPEKARHALTLGLRSPDDRLRKRMLEDFEKHGLFGAATDFALLLLQFTRRSIRDVELSVAGETRIGADPALVLNYRQISGPGAVLDFFSRKATRHVLKGQLFVRKPDGLPLRITALIERTERGHTYRDDATVEYTLSSHGFLTPASVIHRAFVDSQLITENLFRYAPFKRFSAEAELNFTEVPELSSPKP
jgi:hypothetical protein